ncbi:MAG: hypothetical protein K9G62_08430 [Alphaproteobacteria bacterium]|nr:hypothetical protein [Alphaproteobacteria bacterium]
MPGLDEEFPVRIDLKGPLDFAHSFRDLCRQAFGKDKNLILEYRKMEGYEDSVPLTFSLADPKNIFTKEFLALETRVRKAVAENLDIQDLLAKKTWDRQDRFLWEGTVSDLIVQEMNKSPIFKFSNYNKDGTEIRNLNELTGTGRQEYDCESMALIKGLLTQRVEDLNLPSEGQGYKKSSAYYYFSSRQIDYDTNVVRGHASIFCPALGNVSDQRSLCLNAVENYGMDDFKNSKPIFSYSDYMDGSVHLAQALSDMEAYALDINPLECAEENGKKYLSTDQTHIAQQMNQCIKQYNQSLTKVPGIRGSFTQSLAKLSHDSVLSSEDLTALAGEMSAYVKTNTSFSAQERLNLGLGSIFTKNAASPTHDLISYAGATIQFKELSPDTKPVHIRINF